MRLPRKLLKQNLQLIEQAVSYTVEDGVQKETLTSTVHWEGRGSLQPRRDNREGGYFILRDEDVEQYLTPYVAWVPASANPQPGWMLKNLDTGEVHEQLTEPKNSGGYGAFWRLHLSAPTRRV